MYGNKSDDRMAAPKYGNITAKAFEELMIVKVKLSHYIAQMRRFFLLFLGGGGGMGRCEE